MVVADTTVLVAVLDSSHQRHDEAISRLSGVATLHVPTAILSELALVLRRLAKDQGHDGNKYARDAVSALMAKREVHERQEHDGARARTLWTENPRLSYADAVAIATAWDLEVELVTFDDGQRTAWKR